MTVRNGPVVVIADSAATFVPTDGSDVMVFDETSGNLHRLVSSAAVIWAAIDGRRSTTAIVSFVAEHYGLGDDMIGDDVTRALDHFIGLGLVVSIG